MARVEFTEDFDYRPSRPALTGGEPVATPSLIAYKKGYTGTVRREAADQAIAQNRAIELEPKGKDDGEEAPEPRRHRARKAEP